MLDRIDGLEKSDRESLARDLSSMVTALPSSCDVAPSNLDLDRVPHCVSCLLSLDYSLPTTPLDSLLGSIESELGRKNLALSQRMVERIADPAFDGILDEELDRFLKIVQVSDLSALSNTINDRVVGIIQSLLPSS